MHDSANVSSDFVDGCLASTLSWDGLHRHLALVMLADSFLMLQRLQLPLPTGEDVPFSVTRSSLPHVHRQILLWLIHTDQIKTFRPRRN